jgi:hypothetical protein
MLIIRLQVSDKIANDVNSMNNSKGKKFALHSIENKPPLEVINEANIESSNRVSERRDFVIPINNNLTSNKDIIENDKDRSNTPDSHNIYKRKRSDKKEDNISSSKISSLRNADLIAELDPTQQKDLISNNISGIDAKNDITGRNYGEESLTNTNFRRAEHERDLETIDINDINAMNRSKDGATINDGDTINNMNLTKGVDLPMNGRPEDKLHLLAIASIIPEQKLMSTNDDEVMFQSTIKRLLNQKITNHMSQTFCDRFAICTKNMLKLYKSKEQFLKMNKPINIIPLANIKSANRFTLNNFNNLKLHFFVIDFNDQHKGKDLSLNLDEHDNSFVKKMDINSNKGKKMTLLSSNESTLQNRTSESKNFNNLGVCKVDSDIFILACENEITANKWVIVLNYFLNNK